MNKRHSSNVPRHKTGSNTIYSFEREQKKKPTITGPNAHLAFIGMEILL